MLRSEHLAGPTHALTSSAIRRIRCWSATLSSSSKNLRGGNVAPFPCGSVPRKSRQLLPGAASVRNACLDRFDTLYRARVGSFP
jgi:hypothetical protein